MECSLSQEIAAMKAVAVPTTQNDMLPSCQDEKEDCPEDEIFPIFRLLPEIWKGVLPYLSESEFSSLINCSPQFRESDGLWLERTGVLLSLVLPIVVSNQRGVTAQTILNMRLVKHATNKGVNSMLEAEYSPQRYWDKITKQNVVWTVLHQNLNAICERNVGRDENGSVTENPFLGRRLVVNIDVIHFGNQIRMQFLHNISIHGHHVSELVCTNLNHICYVFSVLPLVPNVKVLKLCTEEEVRDVEEFVRPVHYPLLPNLEFLDVESFYSNENDRAHTSNIRLNTAFVRHYGVQLKSLNCNDKFLKGWWQYGKWYTQRLRNLERLRITGVGNNAYAFAVLKVEHLPNLQEIHLQRDTYSVYDYYIQDVLDVMNKCSTLTAFYLYAGNIDRDKIPGTELREGSMTPLPKLTKFGTNLAQVHSSWFWPFIQKKCEKLEELSFDAIKGFEGREEVYAMITAQAFELAPNLEKITVTYRDLRNQSPPIRLRICRNGESWHRLRSNDK